MNEVGKYWGKEELERIKRDGVAFIKNTRTQQMMPIKWQMYENYFAHIDRLYIPDAVRQLKIPFLIIHGAKDETVPVACAVEMHEWNKDSELLIIENGTHTFGARHPWTGKDLPKDFEQVVSASIGFFK